MNGTWQYIFYKPTVEEIEANFKPKGKWWECMEAYETRMEPVFDRKLNKVKDLLKLLNEALCERALSSTAKARPAGRRIPIWAIIPATHLFPLLLLCVFVLFVVRAHQLTLAAGPPGRCRTPQEAVVPPPKKTAERTSSGETKPTRTEDRAKVRHPPRENSKDESTISKATCTTPWAISIRLTPSPRQLRKFMNILHALSTMGLTSSDHYNSALWWASLVPKWRGFCVGDRCNVKGWVEIAELF